MSAVKMIGRLDPNFAWSRFGLLAGESRDVLAPPPSDLRGAFASVTVSGAVVRLVRDPLGLNKLFWASGEDGALYLSARPFLLCDVGHELDEIRAVPHATAMTLDLSTGATHVERLQLGLPANTAAASVEALATLIRDDLGRWCAALAAAHPDSTAFVCLSGGLDSAGALVLAHEHFKHVVAVSFDIERAAGRAGGGASADRLAAERLTRELGLPLLCITVTEEELLDGLDTALREGIDWRDFNVHAALVNVALARGIAAHFGSNKAWSEGRAPLVITGDLPNEYLCDYRPERYGGRTYYPLPRLSPSALRGCLVRGLETTHREVGPFQALGLPVVQIYAAVANHYLALPDAFLADPARKERLARLVFGDRIPGWVHERPKARAQIGDPDRSESGVLAVCADRGVDQAWLRHRFAKLHHVRDLAALERFVRAGRYRAGVPTLTKPEGS